MERNYLIDSSVAVDYLSGKLPEKGMGFMHAVMSHIPNFSVITKIEILGYKARPEVNDFLSEFMNDSVIYKLSNECVEQAIELKKEYKMHTPDAIIAATALVHGLILITQNSNEFDRIEDLEILNPYDSD
ncbi:type II toxin-antitoxin system VapC family toxin [Bacteroidota bacterium]